jgi:lipopolysaccharide/colanic/teichoic acid biosynthesis glycosyltransferase
MKDITRLPDVLFSFAGLVLLSPFFLVIAVLIKATSKGPVFFSQQRVGLHNKDFTIYKFRTMYEGAFKKNTLTIGSKDPRITRIGYFLRKYKLDELPQLYNVLKGEMSLVGPRPELRKYVQLYSPEQQNILSAKPGITDYASIKFRNENDLLAAAANPETYYIEHILPLKLQLNEEYLKNKSLNKYFFIILTTISGKNSYKNE